MIVKFGKSLNYHLQIEPIIAIPAGAVQVPQLQDSETKISPLLRTLRPPLPATPLQKPPPHNPEGPEMAPGLDQTC